jgi:hypothetical protein
MITQVDFIMHNIDQNVQVSDTTVDALEYGSRINIMVTIN